MSNEKGTPTPDKVKKLVAEMQISCAQYHKAMPMPHKCKQIEIANALEWQRDQLKQARPIIAAVERGKEPAADWYNKAVDWLAANPAPAKESEHGND